MNKGIAAVVLGALVVGIGAAVMYSKPPASEPISNTKDAAVRSHVQEFGSKLQMVSLLASPGVVSAAMQSNYGPYLSPELLAAWQADPSIALGRRTSSPWPDRIEVVSIEQIGEGMVYRVEANVIEMANDGASSTQPFAVQPVTFWVVEQGSAWRITEMEKGSYSELPHRQSIVGYWECLPYKNSSGPNTLECAFGIAVDQSDGHFAVNTSLMATYPVDFPTGTKVRVTGVVTPANQLSSEQKYDIDGIISATEIERL